MELYSPDRKALYDLVDSWREVTMQVQEVLDLLSHDWTVCAFRAIVEEDDPCARLCVRRSCGGPLFLIAIWPMGASIEAGLNEVGFGGGARSTPLQEPNPHEIYEALLKAEQELVQ